MDRDVRHLAAPTLSDRKALRASRVVSQTDDVHLCIMCLRAIMNYQVTAFLQNRSRLVNVTAVRVASCRHRSALCRQTGFDLVMKHPRCVNEITLSLNNRNPR